MGRGETLSLLPIHGFLIEMLRMSELLKEHPQLQNWLVVFPVPRVKDWACHWPGKALRCDAADRREKIKVAGTTLFSGPTGVGRGTGESL
jgi:hypothetical protein